MNLKPYLDAAVKADEEVKQLMVSIDAAFNEGTAEGEQKALDLRPALDDAKLKAQEANALYVSMRDASATSDEAAKLFVPVPDPAATAGDNPKVMSRAAFDALDPEAKMSFIKSDGKIVD